MTVTDHDAIRQLLVAYCQTCDDGRFEEWSELYTDDATFTVVGTTHRGRAALRAFIEGAQPPESRGKHFLSEPSIDVDGDMASCVTDYIFLARQDTGIAVTSAGRYLDEVVRDRDGSRYGWRFAAREIVFLGQGG